MSRPWAISTHASHTPHGSAVGPCDAVQPARQDARGRRLADAAGTREDERLRDAVGGNRVLQRLRDAALADDVIEPLRTPLAGNDLE